MLADIEFTVETLLHTDGMTCVDGRVCKAPIRVGDAFTRLFGHPQTWDAAAGRWVDVDPGPTYPIALRVESIESYQRFWDELSSGMAARIKLSRTGVELLRVGKIIGGVAIRK